ncbi:hypothetical protein R6Q59_017945 [Mikania micrantha]
MGLCFYWFKLLGCCAELLKKKVDMRFSPDGETSIGLVHHEGGPCGVLATLQKDTLGDATTSGSSLRQPTPAALFGNHLRQLSSATTSGSSLRQPSPSGLWQHRHTPGDTTRQDEVPPSVSKNNSGGEGHTTPGRR